MIVGEIDSAGDAVGRDGAASDGSSLPQERGPNVTQPQQMRRRSTRSEDNVSSLSDVFAEWGVERNMEIAKMLPPFLKSYNGDADDLGVLLAIPRISQRPWSKDSVHRPFLNRECNGCSAQSTEQNWISTKH